LHSFTEHLARAEYDRKIEALAARAAAMTPTLCRSQSAAPALRDCAPDDLPDVPEDACARAATSSF
jgi:hypothetical protein